RESVVDCVAGPCEWQVKNPSVSDALNLWRNAWEARDFDSYIAMYADSFEPQRFSDRETWMQDRKSKLENAANLEIVLENIRIEVKVDDAIVRFKQIYKSAKFSDTVNKVLHLRNIEGKWLIIKELAQ
ncbi:nuclear transport factor 2 family protein, partial [Methylicorpusculum sp.]|uniref:nuclear transport factor 2 family protein n=1 Tax=Methylicorpusculum sp. TaxID=2713644 RepID=UPI002ABC9A5F